MREVLSILFGAGFTVAVAIACGALLLRSLDLHFYKVEGRVFEFVAGSGVLSLALTLMALVHWVRAEVLLAGGAVTIGLAVWRSRSLAPKRTLPAIQLNWLVPFILIFSAFYIYYFMTALAPEVSPDGSGYHLGNVARTWRNHGFDWQFRSMYAYLSQGAEMLFLMAFAFGGHSAAALVHFTFFGTLPVLMVCYGRRFGFEKPAIFAALLVFASPVMGKDGASAYNDLAVVTVIYAGFYLLQVWDQERKHNLLILIGLLCGFAYAVKYTAALLLPFAVAFIWWRGGLTAMAMIRLCTPAAALIAPWVVRNWVWAGNPFAPFANAWFPNAFYHTGMERLYVEMLKHYEGIRHWWQIPLELTLRGGLVGGMFNPVFLMLPLSLLALRHPQGRRLLFAALVFAVPAWFNIGARFLIPSAPFAAMALGIALEGIPAALPVLFVFAALVGWPRAVSVYCDPWNWRIASFPKREALRQQSVEPYILHNLPEYALRAPIERLVPPGERVFSFAGLPQGYIARDVTIGYESSLGNLIHDILWTPQAHMPSIRQRFRFLPVTTRAVRVADNTTLDGYWTVAEMRVFSKGREVPRDPAWKVSAYPNSWEAPLAFDNSYATRWSTWEALRPGAHVQIDFPGELAIDEVVLECEPAWDAKLQVDVLQRNGRWVGVTDTSELVKAEPPGGIRRAASRDVKLLGFRYLLINEGDFVYQDLKKNLKFWGMTELAHVNETRLYRID
jgi:hypothetical protein